MMKYDDIIELFKEQQRQFVRNLLLSEDTFPGIVITEENFSMFVPCLMKSDTDSVFAIKLLDGSIAKEYGSYVEISMFEAQKEFSGLFIHITEKELEDKNNLRKKLKKGLQN